MGRILAIDPGKKRVGLALSDPLRMISSPFSCLDGGDEQKLLEDILSLIREKNVDQVVVGLPVREDGLEKQGCEDARRLCEALRNKNIDVVLWDERYSSKIASDILKESGINTRNAKDKKDAVAASVLLESYMRSIQYR